MIRTKLANACQLEEGDYLVEFQRGGRDCHILFVKHAIRDAVVERVMISSDSGEARRFGSTDKVHIMVNQ